MSDSAKKPTTGLSTRRSRLSTTDNGQVSLSEPAGKGPENYPEADRGLRVKGEAKVTFQEPLVSESLDPESADSLSELPATPSLDLSVPSMASTSSSSPSSRPPPSDLGPRIPGEVVKPIVYGNVSRYLGSTQPDGHTHEWTIYLKSFTHEDMSAYVKKVTFKLHDSYVNPLRVCEEPPYKVTESGWGEFEITIKIYFIEPNERPLHLTHLLKLFNANHSEVNHLLAEKYDEIVINDPVAWFHERLISAPQLPPHLIEPIETDFKSLKESQLKSIQEAQGVVSREIDEMWRRIAQVKEEIRVEKAKQATESSGEH